VTVILNFMHSRDFAYLRHPNTNARQHERTGPIVIDRGDGVFVYDDQGKEYIEAMAGFWSVGIGFGQPRLAEAAHRQLSKLPYYHSFSSESSEPSIELAERLVKMTPAGLDRVFLTNSGSEANDSVIKLVWFYNNAIGRPEKKKFIARVGGYHGITIARGSLTDLPINHRGFDLPLLFVRHLTTSHAYRFAEAGESKDAFADRLAAELEARILEEGRETVAAFIGEPLIGASGVLPPLATYWEKMQAVCRKYDVLVVADEMINGFGRLDVTFAYEFYHIRPNILVLCKQITSSYMPLAAVVMSDAIYQGVADGSEKPGSFGHGFTASGHPVATAVGAENLKIYEERDLVGNAARVGPRLQQGLYEFASHPLVGNVRGVGLIAAVELVADKASKVDSTRRARSALISTTAGTSTDSSCAPSAIRSGSVRRSSLPRLRSTGSSRALRRAWKTRRPGSPPECSPPSRSN
jgi:4-aminobutyrate--pyruvate transaminase